MRFILLSSVRHALALGGLSAVLLSAPVLAQTGPGAPPAAAPAAKLPPVTARPAPGTYTNTFGLALDHADPTAEIHYSWDGSAPTLASPKLERGQQLFVTGPYEGDKGLKSGFTLRAIAIKPGFANSDAATFAYTIERRDRTAYVSEEVSPGVRMIRDSDNDKMFLIKGAKAYALIDSGLGRGPLREYLAQFTGGLPIIPIFTHSHGDHIGQANQFIEGSTEYVGAPDRPATARFLERQGVPAATIEAHLKGAVDGDRVDLGDRQLEIYAVPGHTPGSIVILDPATGNLFTGDTVGNNSFLPPDVMWMQGADRSLDVYLANVRTMRQRLGGRVKQIITGHNDRPLVGTAYLDNIEKALQRVLDQGEGALIPSWRPAGLMQVVEGDRFGDPNWFGVNVNLKTYLPAASPDKIAGLTGLALTGARLSQPLDPAVHDYRAVRMGQGAVTLAAVPTSGRSQRLLVDGKAVVAGRPVAVRPGSRPTTIVVTAPDGVTTATYRVTFEAPAKKAS